MVASVIGRMRADSVEEQTRPRQVRFGVVRKAGLLAAQRIVIRDFPEHAAIGTSREDDGEPSDDSQSE